MSGQTRLDSPIGRPNDYPAVSTSEARAAVTEAVTAELEALAKRLLTESDRDRRVELLDTLKSDLSDQSREFLKLTELRERQHFYFMSQVLPLIGDSPSFKGRTHDHSKDSLFFFVAAAFFDGGVKSAEMKGFVDEELRHHYEHEPHHPEYELYHKDECTDDDIIEMAIDRLSRNLQFGNGVVDLAIMEKFKPKFHLNEVERKRDLFWENVLKYKDLVQDKFYEVYPNTREWAKKAKTDA